MKGTTHVHYELLRALRNWRTFFLSFGLPLVVYCIVVPVNRHAVTDGISFPLYFMTAMAAYGAMWGAINPGARIARDRANGWVRALRITPLRVRTEFAAKVITAYLVALLTVALLYLAGALFGVRLDAAQWFEMTGLLLVGLAPFVVAGIALGHVVSVDALPAAMGGFVVFLALLGGAFGQLFKGGVMLTIVKLLPSYWLVHAGKTVVGSGSWPAEGWIIVAVWTLCLIPLAALASRHDTATV
ncbi:MAG TPA: ABC transporter permease [Acidimicrobiales bacterium]|nr:ABC transporter permease [Acidimicrobiales bacterium]